MHDLMSFGDNHSDNILFLIFYFFLQVDGNFLDRAWTSKQRNDYTSVLFYASWCPFSQSLRPKFDILNSLFPQVEHLAVERSSALPRCVVTYPAFSLVFLHTLFVFALVLISSNGFLC